MKKIIILSLLTINSLFAQTSEKKIWDLLLQNKREEAQKLFDKELKSKVDSNIDYLILQGFIENENGKLVFDSSFLEQFLKTCKQPNYLYPIWYKVFMMDNASTNGYNDFTYKKIDLLANSELFKNDPLVLYNKAICDRNRKNIEGFNANIKKLNAIEDWQFCGVFENLNDSGIDTEYEPEIYANNDKIFDANSNGKINWYNPIDKQNEGYHFFSNETEYGDGIMYSQVFITSPTDQEVQLNFGTSSSLKIFVNDVEVYLNNTIEHTDLNSFKLQFKLPKGINRLLIKSAIKSGTNDFFMSITDKNMQSISNLAYSNTYQAYNKTSLNQLEVVEKNPDFEEYFKNLILKNPDNVLYKIMLFEAYANNRKNELASEIIEDLISRYPKSSLIQVMQIVNFDNKKEPQKVEEISKNIDINDENYYYNILYKIKDADWLKSATLVELEAFSSKAKVIKSKIIGTMLDFIIASRKSDVNLMLEKVEDLFTKNDNNEFYITTFLPIYAQLKNDKTKAISVLEDLLLKKENLIALNKLKEYYGNANRKEDVEKIVHDLSNRYPYFNDFRNGYINLLIKDKRYKEALIEVNRTLSNFPYSYIMLENKAKVNIFLNDLKEGEKNIRLSLMYNSRNEELRKQLYDITKTPDEIEEVATKDIYKLIKQRRNTTLKGDFGVTTLLDEYIVNVLPEGGRKSKVTFLYEITSEKGIEELKEYNLSRDKFLHSEIVKQDGSIVPAEIGDDKLVFTDLKVGDVVFIQYEGFDNSYGRFYKDFDLSCYFNGLYPIVESIFGFICPSDIAYSTIFNNGNVPFTTKKINSKNATIWKKTNVPAMNLQESYSPDFNDLTNTIRLGTIKSWKEISNWYADLVKKSLKTDKATKTTFDVIFPKGTASLSEDEIARKIYTYIGTNINYSSLDFRQSGYIPQKPSKTIVTKLGDCKDVSTLFVALASLAGLKSNLVLVRTNDNGFSSMLLPSKDFNHCIVKVIIDTKDYFLELTDKYLPYKALPSSLYKANALVISFDKSENENSKLIAIPFENAIKKVSNCLTSILIDDKLKTFKNTITVQGAGKSYYNEIFSQATTDDVRKKKFEEDYNSKTKKVVNMVSSKIIKNNIYDKDITFETEFNIAERLQTVGNLKITDIPFLDKVYTRDIISLESRKYEIEYYNYESVNEYNSEIILNVPTDKKISEIPESKTFSFKGHKYDISYQQLQPNILKVIRKVTLDWNNISVADYLDYKKYVEDVIAAEEQIIGFK